MPFHLAVYFGSQCLFSPDDAIEVVVVESCCLKALSDDPVHPALTASKREAAGKKTRIYSSKNFN
jgi:hypothetical protein